MLLTTKKVFVDVHHAVNTEDSLLISGRNDLFLAVRADLYPKNSGIFAVLKEIETYHLLKSN